jgi:hypothetical protein
MNRFTKKPLGIFREEIKIKKTINHNIFHYRKLPAVLQQIGLEAPLHRF